MASVVIEKLTKRFGNQKVLDEMDLQIGAGEILFLLGPSGCGKTTLLRVIAGLCQLDGGSIRLDDQEITALPPHRRDVAMVFQNYALWPHLSVRENVAFGLHERGAAREIIEKEVRDILERVELAGFEQRRVNQLSGGQQQRVALARALVVKPRLLLLDEPLSNLDADLRSQMRSEIRDLCKAEELTTLFVTHDRAEAESIGDRIAFLESGKIRT